MKKNKKKNLTDKMYFVIVIYAENTLLVEWVDIGSLLYSDYIIILKSYKLADYCAGLYIN